MVLGIIEYGEFNSGKSLVQFHGNSKKKFRLNIEIFNFLGCNFARGQKSTFILKIISSIFRVRFPLIIMIFRKKLSQNLAKIAHF